MTAPTVFVSGATGFIGGAIARDLAAAGMNVLGGVRHETTLPAGITPCVTGDLGRVAFELPAVDMVVHAAGLGHRRGVTVARWQHENIDAAVNLAHAATRAGAKRFVLISTAYVHGRVHHGLVTEHSTAHPADEYAVSKILAEQAVAEDFTSGLTIIRPAAVIGPGCPGNLPRLMRVIGHGMPLPFASIRNLRSFIAIEDLAALVRAVLNAASPPPLLLAAHPAPIATPALIHALAAGMDAPARLFPFPPVVLAAGAVLTGRQALWQSLAGDFIADPAAALEIGWSPRETLADSLRETSRYYNTTNRTA